MKKRREFSFEKIGNINSLYSFFFLIWISILRYNKFNKIWRDIIMQNCIRWRELLYRLLRLIFNLFLAFDIAHSCMLKISTCQSEFAWNPNERVKFLITNYILTQLIQKIARPLKTPNLFISFSIREKIVYLKGKECKRLHSEN